LNVEPDEPTELRDRPGNQSGWTLPLEGEMRCRTLGHELGDVIHYANGMLVGYCVRCPERVEMPWFRGGTAVALARVMVEQALAMKQPAASVLRDLAQVEGLLRDDVESLRAALRQVRMAYRLVDFRVALDDK
jgi:hypothetical protein